MTQAATAMMSPEITEDDVLDEEGVKITIDDADDKVTDTKMEKPLKDDAEEEEDIEDDFLAPYKQTAWQATKIVLLLLLVAYLLAAFIINFKRAKALFTITVLTLVYMAYQWAYKNNEQAFMEGEDRYVTRC